MLLQNIIKRNSHNLQEASPAVVVRETSDRLTEETVHEKNYHGKTHPKNAPKHTCSSKETTGFELESASALNELDHI